MKNFFKNKNSIVVAMIIYTAGLFLYPPFVYDTDRYSRVYFGHHFILTQPGAVIYIDLIRVIAYLMIAAMVCAAWYWAIARSEKND